MRGPQLGPMGGERGGGGLSMEFNERILIRGP